MKRRLSSSRPFLAVSLLCSTFPLLGVNCPPSPQNDVLPMPTQQYVGTLTVQFDEGASARHYSDTSSPMRLIVSTDSSGVRRLEAYEGILPGFCPPSGLTSFTWHCTGATLAHLDPREDAAHGSITTLDGDVRDLDDAVGYFRASRESDTGFFIRINDYDLSNNGQNYTYEYHITLGGGLLAPGQNLNIPVEITRQHKLVSDGTAVWQEHGSGTINAALEPESSRVQPLPALSTPVYAVAMVKDNDRWGDEITVSAGTRVPLLAAAIGGTGELHYAWDQAETLENPTACDPVATPRATTTYTVTVSDQNGQKVSDSIIVTVDGTIPPPTDNPLDSVILVGADGAFGRTTGQLTVNVSVQDTNGDLIRSGLSTANFSFRNVRLTPVSGGSPVNATAVPTGITVVSPSQGDGPMTAVLVFDVSTSMVEEHQGYPPSDPDGSGRRAGGNVFIDLLQPGDELAITAFAYSTWLLQDFTANKTLMRQVISSFSHQSYTAVWDAGMHALQQLRNRVGQGGTVVVLTDGEDNSSSSTADGLIAAAKSQGVTVFTVGLGNQPEFSTLRRVAASTGGAFAEASEASELSEGFAGVGAGARVGFIRVQGTVTYPSQTAGRYTLSGELVTTVGSKVVVTTFHPTVDIQ